jgi:hypothetical protein
MVGFCRSRAIAIALVRPRLRWAVDQRPDVDAAAATAVEITSDEGDWFKPATCGRSGWHLVVPFDGLAPAFVRKGETGSATGR